MSSLAYFFLSFSSVFVIVDALGTIPAFLAMTGNNTPKERIQTARLACIVAAGVLIFFAVMGLAIFNVFGITMPAFQIAGSLVLLMIAHDMLRAQRSTVRVTKEEHDAGVAKDDIAVTPLAVPLLSGPGAITTTILLRSKASGVFQDLILLTSIIGVCIASYLILRLAATGARWLNPIAMRIVTRLMGLLLAAIAFQFFLNATKEVAMNWAR